MLEHRWLAMLYQFQVYCKLIHLYIYWHRDLLSFKFFSPLGYYRMLNSLVSVWSLLSLKYRYMFPFKWKFWNNWRELTAPPFWHVFLLEQWLQDGIWVSSNRQWVPRMEFQPPPAWSSGPSTVPGIPCLHWAFPGIQGSPWEPVALKSCLVFLSLAMLHSMWDLIPGPRIAYAPPSLEAWSPNHWIAREVPSPGLTTVSSPYLGEGSIGPSAGTSGGTLVPVSFMTENGPLEVNELEYSRRTVRVCRQLPETAGLWAACSGPLLPKRLSCSLFLPLSRTDFLKQNCCLYF